MVSRPHPNAPRDGDLERKIVVLVRWGSRILAPKGRDSCLERALVCYRYLSAYGASPQLVVGLGRTHGRVRGHAWVVVDGKAIGDPDEMLADYEPVTTFGPDGLRLLN